MTHIDELIAEYCPDGVEFNHLNELCMIKTGQSVNKLMIQENPGKYPVINSGKEPLGFIDSYNCDGDPIGITSRGAGVGSVTWQEGKYFRGNLNYAVSIIDEEKLEIRFLYFVLHFMQSQIQSLSTYDGIPALNKANLERLKIPVPPIEVQREIVRILDQFTQLEAELEAELETRRRQHEHYQQHVFLSLDDSGTQRVPLRDVGKWYGGGTPSKERADYWTLGTIPWISPKDMGRTLVDSTEDYITEAAVAASATKLVPKDSVALVVRSSILDHTLPIAFVPVLASLNQDMKAVIARPGILPRYLFHALRAERANILRTVKRSGGSVASLESRKLWEFQIPVPSIAEQTQIVAILDKFDALVNNLSVGLPAELAARRKQYEYYRDRLLTFEEAVA